MPTPLERNLSNGFQDFPGLSVSGNIPVKQEFINELLAEVVRKAAAPAAPAGSSSASSVKIDKLAALVKKLRLRADTGLITLEFELSQSGGTPLSTPFQRS